MVPYAVSIRLSVFAALSALGSSAVLGQMSTLPAFPLDSNPLVIHQTSQARRPFSVVGERGAILGQQDGRFELWLLPVKVLAHVHLTARIDSYEVPIDLNAQASEIEVRPDHTTITYSHAAITVKQHMFIPHTAESGIASAVVLFEVHAIRPAEITLSFEPAMERQWPASNFGRPGGNWIPSGSGGAYSLDTDNPAFFGYVAMPNAQRGPLRPYQERPLDEPLEFRFHYDPKTDDGSFYPLLCAVSNGKDASAGAHTALLEKLLAQEPNLPESYRATAAYFYHFFDTRLTVNTPDIHLNEALRWAEISIDQAKVASSHGIGLAGGWFTSGDSARPGFGWFFGRDTLWTLYAVNSYGDFALSREAMNFLLAQQRADGKMMHELSQTANEVDWEHLPYLYAAADSTPLFVMQMEDYVRSSGDLDYLKQHWGNVKRAYAFTRAHTTEGVYDNSQGTGWVEEWIPAKPHQEIYLVALDQQSADAMSRMAVLMNDPLLARQAGEVATMIKGKLADFRAANGVYRFSRNVDGSYQATPSIFPAVAWWSGHLTLPEANETFRAWASSQFSTDWGIRSVATGTSIYDPISYHHGSVWPLYTGWSSIAEYRSGRPLAAYANLRSTIELTWLQDAGAVTEVLSGAYLQPLGRSSSHQLWSSAMLLTPTIRGLFGLEADALHHTLHVAPQLPANWDRATVDHVWVGNKTYTISFAREGDHLAVDAMSADSSVLCLEGEDFFRNQPCAATPEKLHHILLPLPEVEVAVPFVSKPEGESPSGVRVLEEHRGPGSLTLQLEAPAGSSQRMVIRRNATNAGDFKVEGATISDKELQIAFPVSATKIPGNYIQKTVQIHW